MLRTYTHINNILVFVHIFILIFSLNSAFLQFSFYVKLFFAISSSFFFLVFAFFENTPDSQLGISMIVCKQHTTVRIQRTILANLKKKIK